MTTIVKRTVVEAPIENDLWKELAEQLAGNRRWGIHVAGTDIVITERPEADARDAARRRKYAGARGALPAPDRILRRDMGRRNGTDGRRYRAFDADERR